MSRGSLKTLVFVFFLIGSMTLIVVDSQAVRASSDDSNDFFEKRIRPILMTNCAPCHNPKTYVAKLDLTTGEGFARGSENGALIDPANPEKSRLLRVVGYTESIKMPPKGKLLPDDISALTERVKLGAPWPNTTAVHNGSKPAKQPHPPRPLPRIHRRGESILGISTAGSYPAA